MLAPAPASLCYLLALLPLGPLGSSSVAALDDVDGDGAIELVVGRAHPGTSGSSVGVFSSCDGKLVHCLRLDVAEHGFGTSVARWRDLDGDGVAEFAVGAPGTRYRGAPWRPVFSRGGFPGVVYVHSGRTGALVRRFTGLDNDDGFGHTLASADLDGDGREELVVGSPGAGRVCVFDGEAIECKWRFERPAAELFGMDLCVAGDLDSDGALELLAGGGPRAYGKAFVFTIASNGFVRIHRAPDGGVPSGDDGDCRVRDEFDAPRGVLDFGCSVASLGDLDGDRIPDYVLGARGAFTAFSGASGKALPHRAPWLRKWAIPRLAALGDVDQDGVPDFALGDVHAERAAEFPYDLDSFPSGSVQCVSGRTFRSLWRVDGPRLEAYFGAGLARVPDVDGDGADELLVEARGRTGETPSFHLLSGRTGVERILFQFPGDAAWRAKRDAQR